MTARTTIVTVTFNSAGVIEAMLKSVPVGVPVTVVDNASGDATCDMLSRYPNVRLVKNDKNEGFARACNRGASESGSEFLLFLNPDAVLSPGALDALEAAADARPALGAANPRIENAKGKARLKLTSVLPTDKVAAPRIEEASRMPVLSGAALFVRRAAFDAVGGFDPNIFLYHEDHELCWRLHRAQYELWHIPGAKVRHVAGTGAARSVQMAHWKGYQMGRSRYYVLEKARPGSGLLRTLPQACLGLISPANLFSARRRQKFIGQIHGALSARRDRGIFQQD